MTFNNDDAWKVATVQTTTAVSTWNAILVEAYITTENTTGRLRSMRPEDLVINEGAALLSASVLRLRHPFIEEGMKNDLQR